MMLKQLFITLNLVLLATAQQPHIIFVFIDDLGWNDVGYHGSEIMSPNIDQLAAEGVKLENYFVQPLCSPSRTQFLTGRYQIHTCARSDPFDATDVGGLSLEETTMPERLKDVGYSTHLIGKWHLGYSSFDYVPTARGFDTFYGACGLYNGAGDHFEHTREEDGYIGVDLHDDVGTTLTPIFTENGTYSTYLFAERAADLINNHNIDEPLFLDLSFPAVHTPLQAPQEYIDLYEDIEDEERRILAGMTTCIDDAIANITAALQQRGMWNNTVFIFSTDNGGTEIYGSDNSPLRREKGTYFNGGIQGVAFVTSPLLSQTGVEYTGLLHVSDWMETLVNLAGGDVSDLDLDGFDVWNSISDNTASPRAEILHHIDPDTELKGNNTYPDIFDVRVQAALTNGMWKIMTGSHAFAPRNILLFNLATDPYETTNVAEEYPEIVETLLERLAFYNSTAVPPCELETDPEGANPENHGGAWMPWL